MSEARKALRRAGRGGPGGAGKWFRGNTRLLGEDGRGGPVVWPRVVPEAPLRLRGGLRAGRSLAGGHGPLALH